MEAQAVKLYDISQELEMPCPNISSFPVQAENRLHSPHALPPPLPRPRLFGDLASFPFNEAKN